MTAWDPGGALRLEVALEPESPNTQIRRDARICTVGRSPHLQWPPEICNLSGPRTLNAGHTHAGHTHPLKAFYLQMTSIREHLGDGIRHILKGAD